MNSLIINIGLLCVTLVIEEKALVSYNKNTINRCRQSFIEKTYSISIESITL